MNTLGPLGLFERYWDIIMTSLFVSSKDSGEVSKEVALLAVGVEKLLSFLTLHQP